MTTHSENIRKKLSEAYLLLLLSTGLLATQPSLYLSNLLYPGSNVKLWIDAKLPVFVTELYVLLQVLRDLFYKHAHTCTLLLMPHDHICQ